MNNSFDQFEDRSPARIPRVASAETIAEGYKAAILGAALGIVTIAFGAYCGFALVVVSFYSYWRVWKLEQLRYTVENRLYCPLRDEPDEFGEYELQAIDDKPFCFACNIPHFSGHCFDMD